MTKKDYIIIARVFKMFIDFPNLKNRNAIDAINELARRLVVELEKDNPKFNAGRFYAACGL